MHLSIISGSHRHDPQSGRVARYVEAQLKRLGASQIDLISLADNPLPLWDEGVWADEPKWVEIWSPIAAKLRAAEGFVVVSPEWSGMVPAGLKNFFLLCGNEVLAHKPGLIVTVSAGMGGAYPVNELRTSSYKNTRLCYIPDHVIVRHVADVLQGDEPAGDADAAIRRRIEYSLRMLMEYTIALRSVRSSGAVDLKEFPYGM